MIKIKSEQQIKFMREAGKITASALLAGGEAIKPGVSTAQIDKIVHDVIVQSGAVPSFLGYGGFPGSACISVNEQLIHGIPSKKIILKEGDIVSIDVGAKFHGVHGDCAATFAVGTISDEARKLIDVTRQSFFEGIKHAIAGNRISDISHAVQQYAENAGFYVVKDYVGHGVGTDLHEDPEVPNYGAPGHGVRLQAGMVIAVEPMINQSCEAVKSLKDGWTVVTRDGGLSAHYENTILITDGEPEILTKA